MPSSYRVRRAVRNDAPSIVAFNAAMALETESLSLDQNVLEEGVLAVFDSLSETGGALYFVAEQVEDDDDAPPPCPSPPSSSSSVVACAMVTFEWSDWRNAPCWWAPVRVLRPAAPAEGCFRSELRCRQGRRPRGGLVSSRPEAAALVALSGLEEFAIAPTERPRAWTVAFLSGSTQPRICGGKLLLPKVNESGGGGDEKVALFCFREREKERESVFTFFSQQVSAKEKEVNERVFGRNNGVEHRDIPLSCQSVFEVPNKKPPAGTSTCFASLRVQKMLQCSRPTVSRRERKKRNERVCRHAHFVGAKALRP